MRVVVQWGIDYHNGLGVALVRDEAEARRIVQSYVDHPEALDEGAELPTAVSRTVTMADWSAKG